MKPTASSSRRRASGSGACAIAALLFPLAAGAQLMPVGGNECRVVTLPMQTPLVTDMTMEPGDPCLAISSLAGAGVARSEAVSEPCTPSSPTFLPFCVRADNTINLNSPTPVSYASDSFAHIGYPIQITDSSNPQATGTVPVDVAIEVDGALLHDGGPGVSAGFQIFAAIFGPDGMPIGSPFGGVFCDTQSAGCFPFGPTNTSELNFHETSSASVNVSGRMRINGFPLAVNQIHYPGLQLISFAGAEMTASATGGALFGNTIRFSIAENTPGVVITPVPEPSAIAVGLAALGIGAVVARRRAGR